MPATEAICLLLMLIPLNALAIGENQLYTGDAATVPPGKTQFQIYTDHTFGVETRLAGTAFRFGTSNNTEVKLAYSYLWIYEGPSTQVGPNVGFKWRLVGDGLRKPSMAVSGLYAMNQGLGAEPRRNDWGALLIGSYPAKGFGVLANLGRVWVGSERIPDFLYMSYALVRPMSRTTLLALEYSQINTLGGGRLDSTVQQVAIGTVYKSRSGWSYGLQVARLLPGKNVTWHTTVGAAVTF